VERHRPFRTQKPDIGDRHLGRPVRGRSLETGDVVGRESEADLLADARRLELGAARLSERPPVLLEAAQQFEEVERLRQPGFIRAPLP